MACVEGTVTRHTLEDCVINMLHVGNSLMNDRVVLSCVIEF